MKKVFLDFGSNKGQSLRQFIQMYNIDSEWIVESFEPDPSCELDKCIKFVK